MTSWRAEDKKVKDKGLGMQSGRWQRGRRSEYRRRREPENWWTFSLQSHESYERKLLKEKGVSQQCQCFQSSRTMRVKSRPLDLVIKIWHW